MSRIDRKKQDNQQKQNPSDSEISKIYYIVIGLLLLILVGLVIFIFNRSGDNVNLNDGDNQTDGLEQVEPTEPDNNSDSDGTDNSDEVEVPDDNEPETPDNTEDNSNNDNDNESSEETPDNSGANNADSEQIGETVIVNNEAPHDSDHAVEYAAGSSDRIAIKNRVIEVTGLDNDLIEWWIGNDGPGRVKATVSNRESTIYYDVYLQYGEGNWHVTRYQRISGN